LDKNRDFSLTVTDITDSSRLDKWLMTLPLLRTEAPTRAFIQDLIEQGHVLLNGKLTKSSAMVRNGDRIEINIPPPRPTALLPFEFKLDIRFEDEDLLVINKPSGLVVHPAAGHEQDTLVNALLFHTQNLSMKNELRPGIVHRIDKETSGLIVVAKNDRTHESLAAQFKAKTTHRIYSAVAEGTAPKKSGTIKSYLARHPTDRKRFASLRAGGKIVDAAAQAFEIGKWAVTHYEILQSKPPRHLVRLRLETGRTHQIRVHLSEMGLPIVGDTLYGYSKKSLRDNSLARFFLHATELGFTHPTTQESMLFKVPWPDVDLKRIYSWGFSTNEL
jgi:23S rRNA pseudouridine1911/1915/1917 synthase